MKIIMEFVVVVALALTMMGCVFCKPIEDKVIDWQNDRASLEVFKSKIETKAASSVVEALDVNPHRVYKAIADRVDKVAAMGRWRRVYREYVADIKVLEEHGITHDVAIKEVRNAIKVKHDGDATIAKLKEYIRMVKETDYSEISVWINKTSVELQVAKKNLSLESLTAVQQVMDIAMKQGGLLGVKISAQGLEEISSIVSNSKLQDAYKGLELYVEMIDADREALKSCIKYPIGD